MKVHPNNKLTINVVEAAPLETFSAEVCSLHCFPSCLAFPNRRMQVICTNLAEAWKVTVGHSSEGGTEVHIRMNGDGALSSGWEMRVLLCCSR